MSSTATRSSSGPRAVRCAAGPDRARPERQASRVRDSRRCRDEESTALPPLRARHHTTAGRAMLQPVLPDGLPVRQRRGRQEGRWVTSSTPSGRQFTPRGRRQPRRDQGPLLPLRDHRRHHRRPSSDVETPARRARSWRRRRARPTRSRRSSGAASSPTRSAARSSSRSGPRRPTRSRRDGGDFSVDVQPVRHDGRLGCPRQHDCSCVRSPACVAWWPTPKGDIIPRPIKSNFREGLPCSSTSSRRTVLVRVSPTPLAHRRLRLPHASSRRRVPGPHRP